MDTETWKIIWTGVFIVAGLMFYSVVLVVAIKGSRDVKQMIADMLRKRQTGNDPADLRS